MHVVAIIQARMGSTRLPGKVLMDVSGESMLGRVVNRVTQAKLLDQIIIATSTESIDEAIVKEADRLGVRFFKGSENDVLDRYYRAATASSADVVVRITSDCPLIEPTIIDLVVEGLIASGADYASDTLVRTYPRGLDVEAIEMSALARTWREANKPYQKEHVTPYIYENPDKFKLQSIIGPNDYSNYRWTVDTKEDLEFVRAVYNRLGCKGLFHWLEIIDLCSKEPSLTELNRHIKQKPYTQPHFFASKL